MARSVGRLRRSAVSGGVGAFGGVADFGAQAAKSSGLKVYLLAPIVSSIEVVDWELRASERDPAVAGVAGAPATRQIYTGTSQTAGIRLSLLDPSGAAGNAWTLVRGANAGNIRFERIEDLQYIRLAGEIFNLNTTFGQLMAAVNAVDFISGEYFGGADDSYVVVSSNVLIPPGNHLFIGGVDGTPAVPEEAVNAQVDAENNRINVKVRTTDTFADIKTAIDAVAGLGSDYFGGATGATVAARPIPWTEDFELVNVVSQSRDEVPSGGLLTDLSNLDTDLTPAEQRDRLVRIGALIVATALPQASADYLGREVFHVWEKRAYRCINDPRTTTDSLGSFTSIERDDLNVARSLPTVVVLNDFAYSGWNGLFYIGVNVAPNRLGWVQDRAEDALEESVEAEGDAVVWLGRHDTDAEALGSLHSIEAATSYFYGRTTDNTIQRLTRSSFVEAGGAVPHYIWVSTDLDIRLIDGRLGVPEIAADGSDDDAIVLGPDGLYIAEVTPHQSTPSTFTPADYFQPNYLGVQVVNFRPATLADVTNRNFFYSPQYDVFERAYQIASGPAIYAWYSIGHNFAIVWRGRHINSAAARPFIQGNNEVYFNITENKVETSTNYNAGTTRFTSRRWVRAGHTDQELWRSFLSSLQDATDSDLAIIRALVGVGVGTGGFSVTDVGSQSNLTLSGLTETTIDLPAADDYDFLLFKFDAQTGAFPGAEWHMIRLADLLVRLGVVAAGTAATQLNSLHIHDAGISNLDIQIARTDDHFLVGLSGVAAAFGLEILGINKGASSGGGGQQTTPENVAQLTPDLVQTTFYQVAESQPADPLAHWRFDDEWNGVATAPWYPSRSAALVSAQTNPAYDAATFSLWTATEQSRRSVVSGAYVYTNYGYTVLAEFGVGYSVDGMTNWHTAQVNADNWIRIRKPDGGYAQWRLTDQPVTVPWVQVFVDNAYVTSLSDAHHRPVSPPRDLGPYGELMIVFQPFGAWAADDTPANLGARVSVILQRPEGGWVLDRLNDDTYDTGAYKVRVDDIDGLSMIPGGGTIASNLDPDVGSPGSNLPHRRVSFFMKFLQHQDGAADEVLVGMRAWDWQSVYSRCIREIWGRPR